MNENYLCLQYAHTAKASGSNHWIKMYWHASKSTPQTITFNIELPLVLFCWWYLYAKRRIFFARSASIRLVVYRQHYKPFCIINNISLDVWHQSWLMVCVQPPNKLRHAKPCDALNSLSHFYGHKTTVKGEKKSVNQPASPISQIDRTTNISRRLSFVRWIMWLENTTKKHNFRR